MGKPRGKSGTKPAGLLSCRAVSVPDLLAVQSQLELALADVEMLRIERDRALAKLRTSEEALHQDRREVCSACDFAFVAFAHTPTARLPSAHATCLDLTCDICVCLVLA